LICTLNKPTGKLIALIFVLFSRLLLTTFSLIFMGKKIAVIGGGNLGTAIAEGLLKSGFCKAADLTVTKRNIATISSLKEKGVKTITDNNKAVASSEIIILAVKPFQVKDVLSGIAKDLLPSKHILISVVTGIFIKDIYETVNKKLPVFRAMPNTAIAIQQSMTCLRAVNASASQIKMEDELFCTLGKVTVIEEKLMDAATVLGACGTAYAMRYIRANIQGGIEIGFDASVATLIAAQTVKGAAQLLLEKGAHPEQEIDKVTTPKGCTIAGLNEMEHQGFSSSLIKGIAASYNKIVEG
jgi:pyrroline-5-carboxylate reductase